VSFCFCYSFDTKKDRMMLVSTCVIKWKAPKIRVNSYDELMIAIMMSITIVVRGLRYYDRCRLDLNKMLNFKNEYFDEWCEKKIHKNLWSYFYLIWMMKECSSFSRLYNNILQATNNFMFYSRKFSSWSDYIVISLYIIITNINNYIF